MLMTTLLTAAFAADDGGWAIAPFGVGVYLHDRPVRGLVYSGTQAAGLAAAIGGGIASAEALDAGNEDEALLAQGVAAGGAALFGLSWLVSAIDGSRLHEAEVAARVAAVRRFDEARAR